MTICQTEIKLKNRIENCMTEIKKRGGKRDGSGRKYQGYKQFTNARLAPELIEWLRSEKTSYSSWNLFFREIKKRYENQ